MRYNQETVRLASRQSAANKEGKLRHKAPKENSESSTEILVVSFIDFIKRITLNLVSDSSVILDLLMYEIRAKSDKLK